MKKALFVIANNGFQDMEFQVPKESLESAGVEVTISAGEKGLCNGAFGLEVNANMSIAEANAEDYDVIVFIGGGGAMAQYQKNDDYLRLAKSAKIVAAICIAPTLISDSGVLEGKNVTGWDDGNGTQVKYIELNGGKFSGNSVDVDGNIITANGPTATEEFADAIISGLKI